jgi:hypothetical protein
MGLEAEVRDRLAESVRGVVEVRCPAGVIDVLTDTEVIEVKQVRAWKGALGQVLVYGDSYPNRQKRLHLFSKSDIAQETRTLIEHHLHRFHVVPTFEEFVCGTDRQSARVLRNFCIDEFVSEDGYVLVGKLVQRFGRGKCDVFNFLRTEKTQRFVSLLERRFPGRDILWKNTNAPNGERGYKAIPELAFEILRWLDESVELQLSDVQEACARKANE